MVAYLALGDVETVTFIAILIPLVHLYMIRSVMNRVDIQAVSEMQEVLTILTRARRSTTTVKFGYYAHRVRWRVEHAVSSRYQTCRRGRSGESSAVRRVSPMCQSQVMIAAEDSAFQLGLVGTRPVQVVPQT